MGLEQEIKLAYPDVEAARQAVVTAGGRLVVSRRLIEDEHFDTIDGRLRSGGTALRVRRDGSTTRLTFKGPVHAGPVKSREEIETSVADGDVLRQILAALHFEPVFRAQKYREEYALDDATVTVDDTPIGCFVEIEGPEATITHVAARLGRPPADYLLDSYPALWRRHCEARGTEKRDMLFQT